MNYKTAVAGSGCGALSAFILIAIFLPVDDVAVVVPTYTAAAYQPNGFYNYYCSLSGENADGICLTYYAEGCDEACLTVPLSFNETTAMVKFAASGNGVMVLRNLGFQHFLSDEQVTSDPVALSKFRRIIVLHNEYVTEREYSAITAHDNVLYLYPNALFAKVVEQDGKITLDKGHGYKETTGFGWPPSMSTADEKDISCDGWTWRPAPNGKVLSCYPENRILYDPLLWWAVKYG